MKMMMNIVNETNFNWLDEYENAIKGSQKSNFDVVCVDYFDLLSTDDFYYDEELDEQNLLNK
jgi:hypothetical protein